MFPPDRKGNVSCAGEGAITVTQRDCDGWTEVLQLCWCLCLLPVDRRPRCQTALLYRHYRGKT